MAVNHVALPSQVRILVPPLEFDGFHELSPITDEEWRIGLNERFERDECTVDAEALDRIIASGSRHPRSTMLIAQQTHHAWVEDGTGHIDGTLAERGYRGALSADAGRNSDPVDRTRAISNTAVAVVVPTSGSSFKFTPG